MAKGSDMAPGLVLAGAVAAGLYLYKTGAFHNMFNQAAPAATELRLRLLGFHADTTGLSANIEALNPSSVPLQVQSIIGNFIINGKIVGNVKMFGDQVIRPNDQAIIPVAVRVLPAVAQVFRKKGLHVQFDGKINLNNNLLPLQMNYTL